MSEVQSQGFLEFNVRNSFDGLGYALLGSAMVARPWRPFDVQDNDKH